MYEVVNKGTVIFEMLIALSVTKCGYALKRE